ncbi:MAG TPA: amidase [Candidatus Binatia bacterium]|jgi:Asp-tRNA(Asn)/Glu-tRNA(Gln) amidotransferase A subunit family amidase|nr:amidase [Candidatus Binatia bacterium]
MDLTNLHMLSASDAARLIRDGAISSEQLVEACLARVREMDEQVQAWAFLDPDHALTQARAADELRLSGRPIGLLHGVPVGIKDIFDTADMPTENGSVLHLGRTPSRDATVVAMLRGAGAVIMGKTVTTEFAYFGPGKTRNPHNPEHTPGGSSSGSAAAVAAGMVSLALGSQTNGSVIRPAAFCGVLGFKPTYGLIPRYGILTLSRTLDHVGLFARTVEDIALLAEQLVGYDEHDPDTRPRARIPFVEVAAEEPPLPPMFAFMKTPYWESADEETKEGFAELIEQLGDRVEEIELFPSAAEAWEWHRIIMEAEMAANLEPEWERGRDRLSESLRAQIERGRKVSALDYQRAVAQIRPIHESFLELFEQRYDAILTPAAPGTAPKGLASTGDPSFCTLWTLCGMPAISLPLLQSVSGLPLGVQLIGPRDGDARLLRTARWLAAQVATG